MNLAANHFKDSYRAEIDALEAQISMMRGEVLELKTSNRQLTDEVTELRSENAHLRNQMEVVATDFVDFKGETFEVQDDIRTVSSSFSEFIDHFNEFTDSVTANHSFLLDAVTKFEQNYSKISENVDRMQLQNTVQNEALSLELNVHDSKLAGISEDYDGIKLDVINNQRMLVQATADNKAMSANIQLMMYNASMALFSDVEKLREQNEAFAKDLEDLL